MNTNWGYKWRPSHATLCTDTFSGHEAFEAYETRAMANYLANGTTWLPEPEPQPGSGEPTEEVLIVGKEPTPAPAPGKRRVRAFVDLHSYGQLCESPRSALILIPCRTKKGLRCNTCQIHSLTPVMFPFAYSCDDFPPDAEMLMEAGLGVAKTMKNHGGQGYLAGQACDLTYRYVI
jgi:extracellular matrix protein 14